ncbi:GerMN domain-containing protein [Gracilibacillus sp. YIM 98692]|uniref:GerMN domain-containing protein n=1 Tax=Gracilibacillus sp. YIM 98692 TaxID=2663532 RepID=UPI0013D73EAA|nr:GerMN domain-containing protein [Gracilibacillus sp. YIM 98692]
MRIDFRKSYVVLFSALILVLSGCGVFQGEQTLQELDEVPEEANYIDNPEDLEEGEEQGQESDESNEGESDGEETEEGETEEESSTTSANRVLYLLDENGLVVPHEVSLPTPESKEVAKQVLQYLVQGGPVTDMLPNGFQAVLPAGTEILSLNIEAGGTLVVDVSEEFKTYQAENEKKILEAMTYTLTQFENVNRVKLWINGHEQDVMPVNGTPINEGYSRANGINVHQSEAVDLMESKATTLYFPMQNNEEVYFVPVTQHVEMDAENPYQSVVQALLNGPAFDLPLQHFMNTGSQLASAPVMQDGVLSITFNENILSNSEKSMIADEVMQSIVLTLTEQENIEAVEVSIENHDQLVNENGQPYAEPVSRDMFIPTESI